MSHDDVTHGDTPLAEVDAKRLHAAVDSLAEALHTYVNAAIGVRSEFGAEVADDDPRVLSREAEVGRQNAELFDAIHAELGMHPDLTSSLWESDARAIEPVNLSEGERAEVYYLGFLIAEPPEGSSMTLNGVIDLLDDAGQGVTEAFHQGGYDVIEWAASRRRAPGFSEDEDDDT